MRYLIPGPSTDPNDSRECIAPFITNFLSQCTGLPGLDAFCAVLFSDVMVLRNRYALRGAGTWMYPRGVTEHGCE